jgi:predicted CoA-binding protein
MIISDDPEALRRLLIGSKTIAVVGASPKPDRDSHQIAKHLIARGYDVIPVNPAAAEILGKKCYPDLKSIGRPIDIVNVFRSPEHVPPIADEAVAVKAHALWLQSGITHEAAAKKASDAGLYVVEDRCIATALSTLLRA